MRWRNLTALACLAGCTALAQDAFPTRARKYLSDMARLDTTNPPGNETRMARYIKDVLDAAGIACQLAGSDPDRLNVVARLPGSGEGRPLLLMAHSDVVPADPQQWTVPPFAAEVREDYLYGRGTQDDKSLLAAELAVVTELKRRNLALRRDVILLSESDEEAGSTGIQWLIRNDWKAIDAEFALNEGGFAMDLPSGRRVFQVQTAEKVPTRAILRAHGTAGHGSLPRPDNPVVALARAVVRLAEAEQPVRMNATTRRYFAALAGLDEFRWLSPLLPALDNPATAVAAAAEVRSRDPELDAQLHTTMSPTVFSAGNKVNVIPNTAEAQVDVRRMPDETQEEIFARMRRIIHDRSVEVLPAPEQEMPSTEPSSLTTELYKTMDTVFQKASPHALVVPYMQRGATDGSFLRAKGMAVYGVAAFVRDGPESRAHGNDERISWTNLDAGTNLLWEIVTGVSR
jgi:acetylornithine deacetylase/succinyl-diaminopimelate desuccinylase-like protein